MKFSKKSVPSLEVMEAKTLLSGMTLTANSHPSADVATIPGQALALTGTIKGHAENHSSNPDAGASYQVSGGGAVRPLGHVTASGNVAGVGFIRNGHATGTLTLANAHGKVNLSLTGPTQSGPASLPQQFHYTISGGTGAYQGDTGQGTVNVVLAQPGHSHKAGATGARFTLEFNKA